MEQAVTHGLAAWCVEMDIQLLLITASHILPVLLMRVDHIVVVPRHLMPQNVLIMAGQVVLLPIHWWLVVLNHPQKTNVSIPVTPGITSAEGFVCRMRVVAQLLLMQRFVQMMIPDLHPTLLGRS